MSGDAFSHAVENREVSFQETKRPRVNLHLTPKDWCAREEWKGCYVLLDVKGYKLCDHCIFKKKFNIPMMIEEEKKKCH